MQIQIKTEWIKIKKSPIWLIFFLIPLIPAVMGTFNYLQNLEILTDGWYSLWSQHTIFMGYFFLPPMIGAYSAYLWRLEHFNHNWNRIFTMPQPPLHLYLAKLFIVSLMVFLTQCWVGLLFFISGKLIGIIQPFPAEMLVWLLMATLGGIIIASIQLCLSMVIRSFSIPIGIALMGGVFSLAFLARGWGLIFPYALLAMGMNGNTPQSLDYGNIFFFLISCCFFECISFIFAWQWLKRIDVQAE
ncbi:MAG: lantibiotic transport system permease protein [Eubacteriaceae bacterium]|jgi:ABC-2 type transport system permease protein|nr:lantibiotic transport system permease protein [Eubacteriaceae bacterium]